MGGKCLVFSDHEARHHRLKLPQEEVVAAVPTDPDVDPPATGRVGWVADDLARTRRGALAPGGGVGAQLSRSRGPKRLARQVLAEDENL